MISLCTFVKNEENCICDMLNSVYDFVDEIVVVDTGSTDDTIESIKGYDKLRIYNVGFTNFGDIRTLTSHLARQPWVLMLDADETLENPNLLFNLTQNYLISAYAFPRKRWLDIEMENQTELDAYPDWQVRFFRNNEKFTWKRELHEYFDGAAVTHIEQGPIINHFQDVHHTGEKALQRKSLYDKLAVKALVTAEGGHSL